MVYLNAIDYEELEGNRYNLEDIEARLKVVEKILERMKFCTCDITKENNKDE